MYREDDLIRVLGAPAARGNLGGDGSAGFAETPWSAIRRVPLGPDLYMQWDCTSPSPGQARGARCVAISPRSARSPLYRSDDSDRWYVVESCPEHRQTLAPTAFEDVFPPLAAESAEPPVILLIVDAKSYVEETGPDWDMLDGRLREGWRILLVHGDHRFPDHRFVVLERTGVRPDAR